MTTIRSLRAAGLTGAALLLAAVSLPASATAETSTASAANAERNQTNGTGQRSDQDANARRICVRDSFSGSRMVRRICKTAQEWEAAGGVPGSER
jgi:hypothetical protein